MGRDLSGTMNAILAAPSRDIDYTLDLIFPDDEMHFATSPIKSLNGHLYVNGLNRAISEIRQTLEAPVDTVELELQNQDRVLGLHLATYWQKWRQADAIVGRYYYARNAAGEKTGVNEWIEMFRGAVQKPNADDHRVTFDIVPDTISPGPIVCSKTLAPPCPNVYMDPRTCGYAGPLLSCDHHLRSDTGCDGHDNSHHFGGTENRYPPITELPGTGGNGTGGTGGCPRLDQYVRVRGKDGIAIVKMVCFFTDDDELYDPIDDQFYPTHTAGVIRQVPIWEMVTANGAVGYSSHSHRVMPAVDHRTGIPTANIDVRSPIVTTISRIRTTSSAVISRDTGELGDVMFIEMAGGHRYEYGDSPDKMILAHNNKVNPL